MAHFAEIRSDDNIVIRATVVSNEDCVNHGGENSVELEQWVASIVHDDPIIKAESGGVYPSTYWKRTSYNTSEGTHRGGGTPFRLNYAESSHWKYDSELDAFVEAVKPFSSWTLNTSTGRYDAPVADPSTMFHNDNQLNVKEWDEDNQRWTALDSATNINYYWNTETNTWSNI